MVKKLIKCVNKLLPLLAFAFARLTFAADTVASVPPSHYNITAGFNAEKTALIGRVRIEFTNHSKTQLTQLPLITFPNLFLTPPSNLNDVNYEWIYPQRFNPGQMTVQSGPASDGEKSTDATEVQALRRWIQLAQPLAPGAKTTLQLTFTTKIPKKYGSFGRYLDAVTLNGGWYPYLPELNQDGTWDLQAPPPAAVFDLEITYNSHLFVNRQHFYSEQPTTASLQGVRADIVSLVNVPMLRPFEIQEGGLTATVYLRGQRRAGREKALLKSLRQPLKSIAALDPSLQHHFVMVESPMRTEITVPGGDGLILFSDRTMKLFPALRDYHATNLFHAMLQSYVRLHTDRLEHGAERLWVSEAAAWLYTEKLLTEVFHGKRDARELTLLKMFSFLPSVDEVLYAPQFPFTSTYYNLNLPGDFYRSDVLKFNRRTPNGRFMLGKLMDYYSETKVSELFDAYMRPDNTATFVTLAQRLLPETAPRFFAQWLKPIPEVNYAVEKVKHRRHDGITTYHVELKRSGDLELPEPVWIVVADSTGKSERHFWDSTSHEFKFDFDTKTRIHYVQIDPQNRLTESTKADNRYPEKYKFVLTAFFFDFNFSDLQSQLLIATQWRKVYPDNNRYNFGFLYDDTGTSFSLGYSRLFGEFIDTLRLSHGIGFSIAHNTLDSTFLSTAASGKISPSGNTTTLHVNYGFGNRLAFFNPMQGMLAGISLTAGLKALGGDFDFYRVSAGYVGIKPITPQHLLVGNIDFGVSGDDTIPTQEQFILGGINSLRAFSLSDPRLVGRNKLQVQGEYRHTYVNDLDINLFELLRLRKIQGVLFADSGRVTDSVAELIVTGKPPAGGDIGGLFDVTEFFADAGYGIRLYVDAFGVRNTLVRFDAATPLAPTTELDPLYYFSLSQAF